MPQGPGRQPQPQPPPQPQPTHLLQQLRRQARVHRRGALLRQPEHSIQQLCHGALVRGGRAGAARQAVLHHAGARRLRISNQLPRRRMQRVCELLFCARGQRLKPGKLAGGEGDGRGEGCGQQRLRDGRRRGVLAQRLQRQRLRWKGRGARRGQAWAAGGGGGRAAAAAADTATACPPSEPAIPV